MNIQNKYEEKGANEFFYEKKEMKNGTKKYSFHDSFAKTTIPDMETKIEYELYTPVWILYRMKLNPYKAKINKIENIIEKESFDTYEIIKKDMEIWEKKGFFWNTVLRLKLNDKIKIPGWSCVILASVSTTEQREDHILDDIRNLFDPMYYKVEPEVTKLTRGHIMVDCQILLQKNETTPTKILSRLKKDLYEKLKEDPLWEFFKQYDEKI